MSHGDADRSRRVEVAGEARPVHAGRRDLTDFVPFMEAARQGSFSAAARILQQTPSAVSKSIARLERSLSTRLFNRSTRQLQLTAEGQAFFDKLQQAFAGIDDAIDALSEARHDPSGLVRISTIVAFGKHFVMPLVREMLAAYPRIELEIQFDDGTPDMIAQGFDLAIRRGPVRDKNTVARRIASLPLIVVASPEYLAAHGIPRTPADLASHECVSIRFPSGRRPKWIFMPARSSGSRAQPIIHYPKGRLVVSEQPADTLVQAALMGAGVTAIAGCFVLEHLRAGRLQVLLPGYRIEPDAEVHLQYAHRAQIPLRVRTVADFLIEHLAQDERLRATNKDFARSKPA